MMSHQTTKGETTRQALMDAGFAMFAQKGYLRAQIGDIARLAGKSNGVFHIYFKNKDALLDAWLDQCDALVPWFHTETGLLFEKARPFLLQSFWTMYERFGPVLEALDAAALVSDHFHRRRADILKLGDDSIAQMIRHAQARGRCHGIDPELAAISISAMIRETTAHWFKHQRDLMARGITADVAIDHLDTLYRRVLQADIAQDMAERKRTNRKPG